MDNKEINLLLSVSGSDESIIDAVKEAFQEVGLFVNKCEVRTGKSLIAQYLSANRDTSAIVLSQYQGNVTYSPAEVDAISTMVPDLKVILILDEKRGSTYLKELEACGIYTALFEDDADYQTIANLVLRGRSKKAARIYYGVVGGDVVPQQNTYDARNAVSYLVDYDGTVEDMTMRLAVLSERLSSESKMIEVFSSLPREVFGMVSRVERYSAICKWIEEQRLSTSEIKKDEKVSRNVKKTIKINEKKEKLTPVDVLNMEGRRDTLDVGFVSTNVGVGCTTSAIMFAHSIAKSKNKPKVAVIEFDDSDSHFENLCKVVTEQKNISGLTMFSVGEVDYYFNTSFSKFSAQHKPLYDVVVYDFGCCDDVTIETYVLRLYRKFVVSSPKEWRYGELIDFLNDVSPKDINDSFIYLFPCVKVGQDMGNVSEIVSYEAKLTSIPYEANPFSPSKAVEKLFVNLFQGNLKRKEYKASPLVVEKVGMRSTTGKWKIFFSVFAAGLGLSLFAVVLLNLIYKNKYVDLRLQASNYIEKLQEENDSIRKEKEELDKKFDELDLEVCLLKESVPAGTIITADIVELVTIKTNLKPELYLSVELLGTVAASVSLSEGDPLLDCMVAETVGEVDEPPIG